MSAPAVVIEMAAPERGTPLAVALIDACSRAISGGACAVAREGAEEESPAVAIVSWQEQRTKVRVEVGLRRSDHAEWLSRRLEFKPEDSEVERFRSVGLVVATLVGDVRAGVKPTPEPTPAPPPAPKAPTTRPKGATSLPDDARYRPPKPTFDRFSVDAVFLTGTALDQGGPRLGGGARASVRVLGPALVTGSLRLAVRPVDDASIGVTWISGGVGLGLSLKPAERWTVRPYAEALVEQIAASTTQSGARDQRSRLVAGARLGADLAWSPGSNFAPVLGLEAAAHEATTIQLHGRPIERESAFGVTGFLGLRLQL